VKALAPGFLIAMPQLQDPNFEKSVVLMIEHSSTGAMGLVINRQAPLTLSELGKNQDLSVAPSRKAESLYIGGPVEQYKGFVLHDSQAVEEKTEVLPGLFLSVTGNALSVLLADPTANLRFCLGYSGWGAGQVEREIGSGSWLFTEASVDRVLRTPTAGLWNEVLEGMGLNPGWIMSSGGVN
jgi:putative transcriptional regulator